MEIIKHPLTNRIQTAPAGMDDVNDLPVVVLQGVQYSFWKPDAEELALLNAGHSIALGVWAEQHPVVSVGISKEPV